MNRRRDRRQDAVPIADAHPVPRQRWTRDRLIRRGVAPLKPYSIHSDAMIVDTS